MFIIINNKKITYLKKNKINLNWFTLLDVLKKYLKDEINLT